MIDCTEILSVGLRIYCSMPRLDTTGISPTSTTKILRYQNRDVYLSTLYVNRRIKPPYTSPCEYVHVPSTKCRVQTRRFVICHDVTGIGSGNARDSSAIHIHILHDLGSCASCLYRSIHALRNITFALDPQSTGSNGIPPLHSQRQLPGRAAQIQCLYIQATG